MQVAQLGPLLKALQQRIDVACITEYGLAGLFVQPLLQLGAGQVCKEFGDALVFVRLFAAHHPQAGAADNRILRRARDVGVIGQLRQAERARSEAVANLKEYFK